MTTENATLDDFTTGSEEDGEILEDTENRIIRGLPGDTSNDADDEINLNKNGCLCPNYEENFKKYEEILEPNLVDRFNLSDIKCGHAIRYIGEEVDVTLARSTVESYACYLRRFVEFLHERETTVCEAEMNDVKQYFNRLVRLNRSESTLRSHRSAITNLYKHIEVYGGLDTNVRWSTIRELINPDDYNTPPPRERKPLEKDEVKKLYEAAGNFRNRLIIQVGVELGPRNVDLRSIRIKDVYLDDNRIELSNTKSGGSYELPISSQLSLLLRRWIEQERAAHPGAENSDYLFPNEQGGDLAKQTVTQIVKEAADSAGIQEKQKSEAPLTDREKEVLGTEKDYVEFARVTTHTLRHTFNYLLDLADIPRDARSAALDHQSEEVTKEFYDHNETNYSELLQDLFLSKGSLLED